MSAGTRPLRAAGAEGSESENMTREESFAYYQRLEPKDMFDVKESDDVALPEPARIFDSYRLRMLR